MAVALELFFFAYRIAIPGLTRGDAPTYTQAPHMR